MRNYDIELLTPVFLETLFYKLIHSKVLSKEKDEEFKSGLDRNGVQSYMHMLTHV